MTEESAGEGEDESVLGGVGGMKTSVRGMKYFKPIFTAKV